MIHAFQGDKGGPTVAVDPETGDRYWYHFELQRYVVSRVGDPVHVHTPLVPEYTAETNATFAAFWAAREAWVKAHPDRAARNRWTRPPRVDGDDLKPWETPSPVATIPSPPPAEGRGGDGGESGGEGGEGTGDATSP